MIRLRPHRVGKAESLFVENLKPFSTASAPLRPPVCPLSRQVSRAKRTYYTDRESDADDPLQTCVAEILRWRLAEARTRSHWAKLHLLQYCSAEQAIGIGELFPNLEMVVAFHDGKCHGLGRCCDRGGEIPALALEFWGLGGAVDQRDRCHQLIEVALRAELLLNLVAEFHIARARGETHRLQVKHPAAGDAALD